MKSTNPKNMFCQVAFVMIALLSFSLPTLGQTKVFSHPADNDQYAFSGSNENYTFYSVCAGNTDGGFRFMGIIREDKKSKEKVVMYQGDSFSDFYVYGDWLYFRVWSEGNHYIRRMKTDGSFIEWIKTGEWPFFYKNKIYYNEANTLKYYNLTTDKVEVASKNLKRVNSICNDVAVILDHQNAAYELAQLDPSSGVVTKVERFRLNGMDYYYRGLPIVCDGYIYYSAGRQEDDEQYLLGTSAVYRSKLRDNTAFAESFAFPPTPKTGAHQNMSLQVGIATDDNYIYINYRAMQSPDNGEIWKYSYDGKEKKRVTILLTCNMSKCEDWIYTLGQWTWEQRRTNVKTGKQELLFNGKADDLKALAGLKKLEPKFSHILYPNYPTVIVDKLHKYAPMGYSLSTRKDATKYYRLADVATMLSKTTKAFNYTVSNNTVTFTFGSYSPSEQLKERSTQIAMAAVSKKGFFSAGSIKKPVTYYEADGEYFFLFRDILGILGVGVSGSNVTTVAK